MLAVVISRLVKIMDTVNIRVKDLEILLEEFDSFIEEDSRSCDCCKFCGMRYGNADLMRKRGEKLTHHHDCAYLVAQDVGTGL